ncbi:glucose 1-dehydrogenase [Pseudonocardia zijingensis]|uniref:Glucose 1-dehydrogenase n=1 Tax=Pseudonocardia zijingensis TaxID=153376 RepID=A0ABP3ZLU5_9PSEU
MLAIVVTPGSPGGERLGRVEEPERAGDQLLVRTLALGVCGTDREILDGRYGWAPPGRDWLVLGHESVGRVTEAPSGSGFAPGDLVVGVVRRPDPEPCMCCMQGDFDMCRNGGYRERGIKELDGYGAQLVPLEPEFAVKVDPALGLLGVLTEPTSVVAKAWEQIDRIRYQGCRPAATALITGAGPIGLLAALLGAQRGLDVHVVDRMREGTRPELARMLGASYHSGPIADVCRSAEPDVVLECTGRPEVVVEALRCLAPAAVACLLGISPRGRALNVDVGALNNELVLENHVVFGSVNGNHRHFAAAADALAAADPLCLGRMITRSVPLVDWTQALERRDTDIKTVIEFADEAQELRNREM